VPISDHAMWYNEDQETRTIYMERNYEGLPAAASVEQSIVLAQLMILRDLERRAQEVSEPAVDPAPPETRRAA